MSVNRVTILGNLGQDPELKTFDSGQTICKLRVATSEKFKDKKGEKQETVTWHSISVWGVMAQNCSQYLKKGSQVYVEGKLSTRSYEKDGEKRYSTEIVASSVQFIGGGKSESKPKTASSEAPSFDDAEPLPF
jgi:single-strand DNA-binding protein